MDRTLKIVLGISVSFGCIFLLGFRSLNKSINHLKADEGYISTQGVAEKKVKADVVEVRLIIKNKSDNLSELNTKRLQDKQKVQDFLSGCGFKESEIISFDTKTENTGDANQQSWVVNVVTSPDKAFSSKDSVYIKTSNFANVEKLKNDILKLTADGIVVSYKCKYKISDIEELKGELFAQAARNAEKQAQALLKPFNEQVTKLHAVNYTSIDIMDEDQANSWTGKQSEVSNSPMRKIEAKVSASFKHR